MRFFLLIWFICSGLYVQAQAFFPASYSALRTPSVYDIQASQAKLFQRNHGMIIGLQRGKYTTIEFGGEIHWRKISLTKPRLFATTANMEYNFSDNVIGYKAGVWFKRGRINLTYGANLVYFTDFDKSRFGVAPSIGFRLLGFHLVNSYNFLAGDKELDKVNTLNIALRYYFPIDNAFNWKKKNNDGEKKREKKKKEKSKKKKKREKEKKKKARQKQKNKDNTRKKLFG
ncbi:hypothetical protein GXP67_01450 [Rhodocytophaga rosea]|uniref:Outer membrane protein beta-barrel domain-containing protein n=1 Tax=Rhodocytophaga rosea TaxID=2704465 RepID=A0A6C0GC83_9BACT|nr:hypothetical protein [Rhodocytophaga rosea]QHT65433.1 hypothetical protein GXP67_01450 [Rhodocytophaga rosea]